METTVVNGIVISSMPIGEYDRRLEILTDSLGRISVFARGARKPSSPLVACSRTFAFGTFHLYEGRTSYTLHAAEISEYFTVLSEDFERSCYGSYFLELARYFSREGLEAEGILALLYYSLKALSSGKFSLALVRSVFELKMIVLNGIYQEPDRTRLSQGCAYTFDFVVGSPVAKLFSFKLSDTVESEFESAVSSMLTKVVDKKFKSLEMLKPL